MQLPEWTASGQAGFGCPVDSAFRAGYLPSAGPGSEALCKLAAACPPCRHVDPTPSQASGYQCLYLPYSRPQWVT